MFIYIVESVKENVYCSFFPCVLENENEKRDSPGDRNPIDSYLSKYFSTFVNV